MVFTPSADDLPSVLTLETQPVWTIDDGSRYRLTVEISDPRRSLAEVRVEIDRTAEADPKGSFSWRDISYVAGGQGAAVACRGGGWAEKMAGIPGSKTMTLQGCSVSRVGDRVSLSFLVLPNPSFGAGPEEHLVSAQVFDWAGASSGWVDLPEGFRTVRSWLHRADALGYQGVLLGAHIEETVDIGVPVDLATLLYLRKECTPHYWREVDTAGILEAYQAHGAKAMVILENFLFHDVNDPIGDDCQPLDPPPTYDPSACFDDQKWRLLPDWRDRLAEFDSLHGSLMTPENIELLLVSSEVNDRCFDLTEVELVAQEARSLYPEIPLAMIYGATHGADGQRLSQPAPSHFPPIFDLVGLFSYDLFDLDDPHDPRNATHVFYDPESPSEPSTLYGDLLGKLHGHQKVILVFEANYAGGKPTLGWFPEDLREVAESYERFVSYRPEIQILGGFTWPGLLSLPDQVIAYHGEMACRVVHNDSPWCPSQAD